MKLHNVTTNAIDELRISLAELKESGSASETLPDPAPSLDLESRKRDRQRIIKYLHQLCSAHCWHYATSGRIKLTYLVDGYLAMIDGQNPVGIFALARSLLEFHVSAAHLVSELKGISSGQPFDLLERGKAFFQVIVRTRYATKNLQLRNRLTEAGLPKEYLAWPKVSSYVKEAAAEPNNAWITEHYDVLCDYVHHNLPSNSVAAVDLPYGRLSHSRKGTILTAQAGTQVTYAFPSEVAVGGAIELTAPHAVDSLRACLHLLQILPETPFTPAELRRETGTATGSAFVPTPGTKMPGRNEPCWCGSGIKFKKCHG